VIDSINPQFLRKMAKKYIWWKTPDDAIARPVDVMAQVMNIGEFDDVVLLTRYLDEPCLREILQKAEAGQFNERSWSYWHYRLGLAASAPVPSLPVRISSGELDENDIKVSFFAKIGIGRVDAPALTDDGVLQVASLNDLMATKLKVIGSRR
jgi:hypothetical protein